jgi:Tat protein secretion system quality control protein TatD with DNase activity
MERFVDTHAHIYGEEYAVDVEEVIMRARNAGAEKIFLPATNLTTVEEALSVCMGKDTKARKDFILSLGYNVDNTEDYSDDEVA